METMVEKWMWMMGEEKKRESGAVEAVIWRSFSCLLLQVYVFVLD